MARSRITLDGLPHSEIFGSKPVCGSPKLIAAYHVLHRRPAPRHPPYALSSLTTTSTLSEICSDLHSSRPRLHAGRCSRAYGALETEQPLARGPLSGRLTARDNVSKGSECALLLAHSSCALLRF